MVIQFLLGLVHGKWLRVLRFKEAVVRPESRAQESHTFEYDGTAFQEMDSQVVRSCSNLSLFASIDMTVVLMVTSHVDDISVCSPRSEALNAFAPVMDIASKNQNIGVRGFNDGRWNSIQSWEKI